MSTYEAETIARAISADRVREATQRRLVREVRRGLTERPRPLAEEWQVTRPAPFWRLVHRPYGYR
jgi:hypothetical protein